MFGVHSSKVGSLKSGWGISLTSACSGEISTRELGSYHSEIVAVLNAAWFPRTSGQTGQDGTAARMIILRMQPYTTQLQSASTLTFTGDLPVPCLPFQSDPSVPSLELLSLLEPVHHSWRLPGFQSHVVVMMNGDRKTGWDEGAGWEDSLGPGCLLQEGKERSRCSVRYKAKKACQAQLASRGWSFLSTGLEKSIVNLDSLTWWRFF